MPKFIAHALVGIGIVTAIHPTASVKKWTPLVIGGILAVSPDFDYPIEWILNLQDFHRGLTHSIIFSAIFCIILSVLFRRGEERAMTSYSLAYLSHLILDCLTSTTGGVKIFFPFSTQYYNFGLTNIFELPVGKELTEILKWVLIELVCFLPPVIILLKIKHSRNKKTQI